MKRFLLTPDSGPDIEFDGTVLAEVSSRDSGRDQWSVLRIYRTAGGSFVAERERWRDRDGAPEQTVYGVGVCPDAAAVVRWFHGPPQRPSWLTKELLDAAGIAHAEHIP